MTTCSCSISATSSSSVASTLPSSLLSTWLIFCRSYVLYALTSGVSSVSPDNFVEIVRPPRLLQFVRSVFVLIQLLRVRQQLCLELSPSRMIDNDNLQLFNLVMIGHFVYFGSVDFFQAYLQASLSMRGCVTSGNVLFSQNTCLTKFLPGDL